MFVHSAKHHLKKQYLGSGAAITVLAVLFYLFSAEVKVALYRFPIEIFVIPIFAVGIGVMIAAFVTHPGKLRIVSKQELGNYTKAGWTVMTEIDDEKFLIER